MHIFIKNKQHFPLTEAESFLHKYARKQLEYPKRNMTFVENRTVSLLEQESSDDIDLVMFLSNQRKEVKIERYLK